MPTIPAKPRCFPPLVAASLGLFLCLPAHAANPHDKNGSVLLRMCKSGDTVKMLSVMCRSYLDGYIDAAHHYGKGKAAFCLDAADRNVAPGELVQWIDAHPAALAQPAVEVLQQALAERFPCVGRH